MWFYNPTDCCFDVLALVCQVWYLDTWTSLLHTIQCYNVHGWLRTASQVTSARSRELPSTCIWICAKLRRTCDIHLLHIAILHREVHVWWMKSASVQFHVWLYDLWLGTCCYGVLHSSPRWSYVVFRFNNWQTPSSVSIHINRNEFPLISLDISIG